MLPGPRLVVGRMDDPGRAMVAATLAAAAVLIIRLVLLHVKRMLEANGLPVSGLTPVCGEDPLPPLPLALDLPVVRSRRSPRNSKLSEEPPSGMAEETTCKVGEDT